MISLLQVADVHFGPKHLAELSAAVLELARRSAPAALVVTGDLTQRAQPGQFRAAKEWIERVSVPVVFLPGNHDVPMYRFWERLLAPFGAWRRYFSPELVRDHVDERIAILALNSAHAWTTKHGRLRVVELARLDARLAALADRSARVVVAHHPLAAATELGSEPVARRGEQAVEICRRRRVDLILCGHLHRSFWLALPGAAGGPGPVVVHCGTTTSSRGRGDERGRNSLHWIEIDSESIRCERRFWDRTAREFVASSRAEFPRARGE